MNNIKCAGFVALALNALCFSAVAQIVPVAPAAPVAAVESLPESYATAGIFYNTYATPHLTGFGAYAKKVATSTYSYTVVDVTSRTLKPFRPETSTTSGIAQRLSSFGGVDIFGIATVGVAAAAGANNTGADVGISGSGGFLLVKPLAKGWSLNLPVRVLASSLGPPQYVIGIGVGWGK